METHQIRYFLSVFETGNFTRAAERCFVSQPALTQAIKKLEDELGGLLFQRERNRVRPTGLGRMMFPQLEQIWEGQLQAISHAQHFVKLDKIPIRIGVMNTLGTVKIAPFFSHFHKEHSGIDVELQTDKMEVLIKRLREDALEAVIGGCSPSLGDEFTKKQLYTEPYQVIFPKSHRFKHFKEIPLKELSDQLYLDRLSCEMRDDVLALCGNKQINIYATFRSEREDLIQNLVAEQLGIALMPKYSITQKDIESRPLIEPSLQRSIHLITLRSQANLPPLNSFLEAIRSWEWE